MDSRAVAQAGDRRDRLDGRDSFWDTVATAYLAEPELFTTTQRSLVAITRGAEQGTILDGDCATLVTVAETVQTAAFYTYLMTAWAGPV